MFCCSDEQMVSRARTGVQSTMCADRVRIEWSHEVTLPISIVLTACTATEYFKHLWTYNIYACSCSFQLDWLIYFYVLVGCRKKRFVLGLINMLTVSSVWISCHKFYSIIQKPTYEIILQSRITQTWTQTILNVLLATTTFWPKNWRSEPDCGNFMRLKPKTKKGQSMSNIYGINGNYKLNSPHKI